MNAIKILPCPICGMEVCAQYLAGMKSKDYYRCQRCGASAFGASFSEANVDFLKQHDCPSCKYKEFDIHTDCPIPDDEGIKSETCRQLKCKHFPCCCKAGGDINMCPIEPAPFEETVIHLLKGILRAIKRK